jgi:hypothetical protein
MAYVSLQGPNNQGSAQDDLAFELLVTDITVSETIRAGTEALSPDGPERYEEGFAKVYATDRRFSTSAAQSTPEPGTAGMLSLGLIVIAARRRGRKQR